MTPEPGGIEAPPRLELADTLRTAAGSPLAVEVTVTNTASAPRAVSVAALGVEANWLPKPLRTPVLEPGQSIVTTLTLTPPTGTLPAQYPLAFTAQALDPTTGRPTTSSTGLADTVLVVNPRNQLALDLRPRDASAVASRRVKLVLRNDGQNPARVRLEVQSSPMLHVDFKADDVEIAPGETVEVPGRASLERSRVVGDRSRFSYLVTARGNEAVRYVEGSVTRRAVVGFGWLKAVAVLAVLSIWIAGAIVFIPQIADRLGRGQADQTTTVTGEGDGSGGDSGESEPGEDDGSGGSGGSDGSGGSGEQAAATEGSEGLALSGTVAGTEPGGVAINLKPIALVDEEAQGAEPIGEPAMELGGSGMSLASAFLDAALDTTPPERGTRSTEDGSWKFPRVRRPGYYLLTFSKPGLQSRSFVVDSSTEAAAQPLEVEMLAGQGRLSGVVTGPDGLVGGATITITDGTNTLSTSSNSQGRRGEWAVTGLSTPATYVVQASSPGTSSESTLVSLSAGGAEQADLLLHSGVASLVGKVRAKDQAGNWEGAGNVTVTVRGSDGEDRTVTTLTQGTRASHATVSKRLAGTYTMPGLPVPGKYVVTFSGDGLQSQTSRVILGPGDSLERLDADLFSASGIVSGQVRQAGSGGAGLSGVAITLSNDDNAFKTTSTSKRPEHGRKQAGRFVFSGVAPGIYTLSATKFRFAPAHVTVRVRAGEKTPVLLRMRKLANSVIRGDPHIEGRVIDAATGTDIACPPQVPEDECTITASVRETEQAEGPEDDVTFDTTFLPNETFSLPEDGEGSLLPGLHRVRVSAPGYESATVAVEVPVNGTRDVGVISLFPAPKITGAITTVVGTPQGSTCVWAVPAGQPDPPSGCGPDEDTPPEACALVNAPLLTPSTGRDSVCAYVPGVGSYMVQVPVHGSYRVFVQPFDTEYLEAAAVDMNLTLGETRPYAVELHRLGRVIVSVREPGPAGNLIASEGTTVDLSPLPVDPPIPAWDETDQTGHTTITHLPSGTYTLTVPDDEDEDLDVEGSVPVTASLDRDVEVTLPMTDPIDSVVGRVTVNFDGTALPVGGASVTVTAPVDYDGDDPVQGLVTMVTDDQGCFAIQGDDAAPSVAPCDAISGPSLGQVTFLAPLASSIQISRDGFLPRTLENYLLLTGNDDLNLFSIDALPVPFGPQTISVNPMPVVPPEADVSWGQATFVVQALSGGGSSINVTATNSGTLGVGALHWNDTRLPEGDQVRPGTYTVTASLPGYQSTDATLSCPFATQCQWVDDAGAPVAPPVLQELGSLTIGASAAAGTVTGAQFTLLKDDVAVRVMTAAAGESAVTFAGLEPGATDYTVRVQAPGHAFGTTGTGATDLPIACGTSASITIAPGENTSCTATVNRLGAVRGTVNGIIGPDTRELAGAQVVVARCTEPPIIVAGTPYCTDTSDTERFTGTTAANGTFRITGTNTTEGLTSGNWLVSASMVGFHAPAFPPSAPDGAEPGVLVQGLSTSDDTTVNPNLEVDPVDLSIRLRLANNTFVSGAIVELLPIVGDPIRGVPTGNGTTYVFNDVLPRVYTLSARGAGLAASSMDDFEVFVGQPTQSFIWEVTRGASIAQGRVTAPDAAGGVSGVIVSVVCGSGAGCLDNPVTGTNAQSLTQQTADNGSFEFRNVPDGSFRVTFERHGYLDAMAGPFTFDHELAALPAISPVLQPVLRNVRVTVPRLWNSDNLTGGSVTLTPTNPAGTPLQAVSLTGGPNGPFTASFNQVHWGCWNVTVTLPANHHGVIEPLQGSPDDSELTCTGNLEVPGVPAVPGEPGENPIAVSRRVNEGLLNLTLTADAQPGHTAPTTASVMVSRGTTWPTVIPIGSATPMWVPTGTPALTVTATPTPVSPFWPPGSLPGTLTVPATQPPAGSVSGTITLVESPARLVVTVTGASADNQAELELASNDGQTVPDDYDDPVMTAGTFTFTLPSGSWNVTATLGATTDSENVTLTALTQNLTLDP